MHRHDHRYPIRFCKDKNAFRQNQDVQKYQRNFYWNYQRGRIVSLIMNQMQLYVFKKSKMKIIKVSIWFSAWVSLREVYQLFRLLQPLISSTFTHFMDLKKLWPLQTSLLLKTSYFHVVQVLENVVQSWVSYEKNIQTYFAGALNVLITNPLWVVNTRIKSQKDTNLKGLLRKLLSTIWLVLPQLKTMSYSHCAIPS